MKIELDDLSGSEKLSCTLWENYASEFGFLLDVNKSTEYIIVLQFAKMKFFNGVMTITNTNFTTKILVNADLEVVKKFRQKLIRFGHKQTTNLKVIGHVVRLSPFEDFLTFRPYASIYQIKDTIEKSTYVTCGTIVDVDKNHAWWYKACKRCTQGLEALTNRFYCTKCDVYATSFLPRFCIQVLVLDETDTATFVLFENVASKFLGFFAADLCCKAVTKGYGMDEFPQELNALVGKTLLFKMTARLDSITKFQSCMIMVSRICSDPEIITTFAYQNRVNLPGSQKLPATPAASIPISNDLDDIDRVVVSTTPLNSRNDTPCVVEGASMVTHTPMKWICVRSVDGSYSHVPSIASRNLLPTFEKNITKEHTDPSGMDI